MATQATIRMIRNTNLPTSSGINALVSELSKSEQLICQPKPFPNKTVLAKISEAKRRHGQVLPLDNDRRLKITTLGRRRPNLRQS